MLNVCMHVYERARALCQFGEVRWVAYAVVGGFGCSRAYLHAAILPQAHAAAGARACDQAGPTSGHLRVPGAVFFAICSRKKGNVLVFLACTLALLLSCRGALSLLCSDAQFPLQIGGDV